MLYILLLVLLAAIGLFVLTSGSKKVEGSSTISEPVQQEVTKQESPRIQSDKVPSPAKILNTLDEKEQKPCDTNAVAVAELLLEKTVSSPEMAESDLSDLKLKHSNSMNQPTEAVPKPTEQKEARKNTVKGFDFRNKGSKPTRSTNSASKLTPATSSSNNLKQECTNQANESKDVSLFDVTVVNSHQSEPSNVTSNSNNATKPPLRGKGFNFRNPGGATKKISSSSSGAYTSSSQPGSLASSPRKRDKENETPVTTTLQDNVPVVAEKKVKGFNFRNANKVKAE